METLKQINLFLARPLLAALRLYQATFSPDHGLAKAWHPHGFCKFYPSCSEYARISLSIEGISSLPRIVWRIARCNPFSQGGVDLPQRSKI